MNEQFLKKTLKIGLLSLSLVGLSAPMTAQGQEPNYGTAMVDGDYSADWNLNSDFFADMYKTGIPTNVVLSPTRLCTHWCCGKVQIRP